MADNGLRLVKRIVQAVFKFQYGGINRTINNQLVKVFSTDSSDNVVFCNGNLTITDGGAGYAKGCTYVKINGGVATTFYVNEGDETSCDFNAMETAASTITAVTPQEGLTGGATEGEAKFAVSTEIYNNTGGTLNPGTLVRLAGYNGVNGITVVKADADLMNPATHVVKTAINDTQKGIVYPLATVVGLNTNGQQIGDSVYLSSTAGGFTFSAPTGPDQAQQLVGVVKVVSDTVGEVVFFPGFALVNKMGSSSLQNDSVKKEHLNGDVVNQGLVQEANGSLSHGVQIFNNTGNPLTKGTLLALSSYTGTDGIVAVLADTDATGLSATHVVATDIPANQVGFVYERAKVVGLNTDGRTIGDAVYLSATAGQFAYTAPTGDRIVQKLGTVAVVDAVNGVIEFWPSVGDVQKFGTSALQDSAITAQKAGFSIGISGNTANATASNQSANLFKTMNYGQLAQANNNGVHGNWNDDVTTWAGPFNAPATPRNLSVTFGSAWAGGNVTITGTNYKDEVINETINANPGQTVAGVKPFKTITGITHQNAGPGGQDHGATVGIGNKIGIPFDLSMLMGVYDVNGTTKGAVIDGMNKTLDLSGDTPDGNKMYEFAGMASYALPQNAHNHGATGLTAGLS